jgi:hypothetical protein
MQYSNKQASNGKQRQETESVRDIKSDEMIVEDNSQQQFNMMGANDQIEGGEEEIEHQEQEDEGEEEGDEEQVNLLSQQQQFNEGYTPEQQQQLQMMIQQQ